MFCDASTKAYGCCVYLRIRESENIKTSLVIAKAKVAPLKRITLPRLELLAAVLGARLLNFAKLALQLPSDVPYTCYTDSMITLSWIQSDSLRWKTFVANRTQEIQSLTDPSRWRHCVGIDNPADILTRGIDGNTLIQCTRWLNGPDWLASTTGLMSSNQEFDVSSVQDHIQEEEKSRAQCMLTEVPTPATLLDIGKYGTLLKAVRVMAWVKRFISRCQKEENSSSSPDLEYNETKHALLGVIRFTQENTYPNELGRLKKGQPIEKSSPLIKLTPFVDEEGLLRAKTRLNYSSLSFDEKYPVILPNTHLAKLIVEGEHRKLKHAGVNQLISAVRNKYWIVGLRCLARKTKRECFLCQRLDAKASQEPIAPLMEKRLKQSFPFENTGLDFAGPIFCKDFPGCKFYILLFTCAVIRAIHLELVNSMNLQDFLCAFRRFVARRGLPTTVFSDNFKTFKKAATDLPKLYGPDGPKWRFSVPRSPWWGGIWEAMVKVVKSSLKKSVGTRALDKNELHTTLIEIEACVNSRPLTFVGDDLSSGQPLTPSHLLLGRGSFLKNNGSSEILSTDQTVRSHAQEAASRADVFWQRWQDEYLKQLPLPSFRGTRGAVKVGSIVLIREDNCPRLRWPLGIIDEMKTGRDGICRTVKVRTLSGTLLRSVQRIHVLELMVKRPDVSVSGSGRTLQTPARYE